VWYLWSPRAPAVLPQAAAGVSDCAIAVVYYNSSRGDKKCDHELKGIKIGLLQLLPKD